MQREPRKYDSNDEENATSPILTLPVEIILQIFVEGTRTWRYLEPQSLPFPTIAASVCKNWRMIAKSAPQLWALLIPPLHREHHTCLAWTSQWLERSRKVPLSVVLDIKLVTMHLDGNWLYQTLETDRKIFEILSLILEGNHVGRLRRLNIRSFSGRAFNEFMEGLDQSGLFDASGLEQLSLYTLDEEGFGSGHVFSGPPSCRWDTLQKLPSLRKFGFLNVCPPVPPPVISSLTSLTTYHGLFLDHAGAKALFSGAPNLAHIIIHDVVFRNRRIGPNTDIAISVPSLRSLAVEMSPSYYDRIMINRQRAKETFASLFDYVSIPALEYLEIQGKFDYDIFFASSLSESLRTVKKLRIANMDHLGFDDIQSLHSFHALEELEIVQAPATEILTQVKPSTFSAGEILWPELRCLTLDTTDVKNIESCIDLVWTRAALHGSKFRDLKLSKSSIGLLKVGGLMSERHGKLLDRFEDSIGKE